MKLDGFCAEFGIDHALFFEACSKINKRVHQKCIDQLIAVENFVLFKKMMIAKNTQLNQMAIAEMQKAGVEIPEDTDVQAQYYNEEAELQQAIEMSKALMGGTVENSTDEAMVKKQAKLETQLQEKKQEKAKKLENSNFPDIFGKPTSKIG